ncbi:hypothetical protein ACWC4J_23895 [Streptomyces sp. NPDC001356]
MLSWPATTRIRTLEGLPRPAAEVQVVPVRDAEDFGDDRRGQRGVEGLDEVQLARRRHRVDQEVGDPLDATGEFGRTAGVKAAEAGRGRRVCSRGSASIIRASSPAGGRWRTYQAAVRPRRRAWRP